MNNYQLPYLELKLGDLSRSQVSSDRFSYYNELAFSHPSEVIFGKIPVENQYIYLS